jgi:hypothetical protein
MRSVAVLLACMLVGAAIAVEVSSRMDLHHAQASFARTRTELQHTRADLNATVGSLGKATRERDKLATSLRSTNQELAVNTQSLNNDNGSISLQSLDLTTLHSCLQGVASAYQSLAGGSLPKAISAINAASGSCLTVEGGASSGLVYPFDFPDPDVLTVGGTYFAYATNSAAGNIQIITSTDLAHWSPVGDALPHLPAWAAPGTIWAPAVAQIGNTFVMYYSAGFALSGEQCISDAVATSPEGPFVDTSVLPLVCQLNLGGSIDPSAFIDPGGTVYLDWKSEGANGQPPTLWAQQLDAAGTSLAGPSPAQLLQPSLSWEDGIVEAPDMFWLDGQRYLFYAGAAWQTDKYAIGAAICSTALGPCTKTQSQPLFSSQGDIVGPGGPTAFWNSSGTSPELAFAGWLPNEIGFPHSRVLFIRPLQVTGGMPVICPATGAPVAPASSGAGPTAPPTACSSNGPSG